MKKKFLQLILFALILMTASTVLAAKETPDQQRAKLNDMSEQVLARMYQKYPSSKSAIQNIYAYCTIEGIRFAFFDNEQGGMGQIHFGQYQIWQ